MLHVRCPNTRLPEREYIFNVILSEFLGVPYIIEYEQRGDVELSLPSVNERKLNFSDVLFAMEEERWLTRESLPERPLSSLDASRLELGRLPVIYGTPGEQGYHLDLNGSSIQCGLDLFGSCFFMLTRYEEVTLPDRDLHDRFPVESSLAYQEGFLDYPIVNLYTELLWSLMSNLWPGLIRKHRSSTKVISHDVDHPFFMHRRSRLSILKSSLADVLKRQEFESAYRKVWVSGFGKSRIEKDPYNTFNWLMELSERAGMRSSFYFIPEHTDPRYDGNYSLDDPEIQELMLTIYRRGHEIGLHPSYQTYLSLTQIKYQFGLLLKKAEEIGIHQKSWGGRQHFLRWQAPETWQHWEDAGLDYDSTLGYSDIPGFRCGVCYEYPVYNLIARKSLKLRERPLVVMEKAVLGTGRQASHRDKAFDEISRYYRQCLKYGGDFTLLWHNSFLTRASDRNLFERCLEQLN